MVKSTYCSSRGFKFRSPHPHGPHSCVQLQPQGSHSSVFLGLSHVYRAMLHTHTLLLIIGNNLNKIKIKIICVDMWEGRFLNWDLHTLPISCYFFAFHEDLALMPFLSCVHICIRNKRCLVIHQINGSQATHPNFHTTLQV